MSYQPTTMKFYFCFLFWFFYFFYFFSCTFSLPWHITVRETFENMTVEFIYFIGKKVNFKGKSLRVNLRKLLCSFEFSCCCKNILLGVFQTFLSDRQFKIKCLTCLLHYIFNNLWILNRFAPQVNYVSVWNTLQTNSTAIVGSSLRCKTLYLQKVNGLTAMSFLSAIVFIMK